ncbi:MAG: hypothetical protein NTW52_07235 [Planctomycetota bacterium]|nr:hypothetical protein [Planctomycetota bacterium]
MTLATTGIVYLSIRHVAIKGWGYEKGILPAASAASRVQKTNHPLAQEYPLMMLAPAAQCIK